MARPLFLSLLTSKFYNVYALNRYLKHGLPKLFLCLKGLPAFASLSPISNDIFTAFRDLALADTLLYQAALLTKF